MKKSHKFHRLAQITVVSCFLSLSSYICKAQTWFVVPDAAFAGYLRGNIPAAMQGDSLNTSSALVTTTTHSLNLSDLGIANLNGVQYFTSLTYLNCSGNTYTSIPVLPNTLTYLDCSYNSSLTALPALPSSLQTLWCQIYSLISLPALPNSLQALYCFNNYLTTLPTLPNSLQTLECYSNGLTTMPAFPASLSYVDCFYNALTTLPAFDDALTYIDCHNNAITTLNYLGNSLSFLYCNNNSLSVLPTLPASLTNLDCDNNSITNLPALPNALSYLDCSYNQLTELPALPPLSQLYCENNNISCFPTLPNTIALSYFNSCLHDITYFINISNNPNTCVPNIIGAMGADSVNYQVCVAGNANGCAVTGIQQQVATINNEVTVYPNPASNSFQVSLTDKMEGNLNMYDVTGKLVLSQSLTPALSKGEKVVIDVNGLPVGVYTINITSNLTSIGMNKKLVIVR